MMRHEIIYWWILTDIYKSEELLGMDKGKEEEKKTCLQTSRKCCKGEGSVLLDNNDVNSS